MANLTFGNFKGKAARSHATSLVSLGTLILWEASHQLPSDLLGAEPHVSRCAVGNPNKPQNYQCQTTVSLLEHQHPLGFSMILPTSYFTSSVPEMSQTQESSKIMKWRHSHQNFSWLLLLLLVALGFEVRAPCLVGRHSYYHLEQLHQGFFANWLFPK
jgi:hypothetical protein